MSYTRSILQPKERYTGQEQGRAASIYGHWQQLEPRCDKGSAEVLRLRQDGPMVEWNGSGSDSGRYLQICFQRKPDGRLKLAAAAGNMAQNSDMPLLIARAIKDLLDEGEPAIYYYATAADQQGAPDWYSILTAIITNLELLGSFNVTEVNNANAHCWEVTLA